MQTVHDNFTPGSDSDWKRLEVGGGRLEPTGETLRFALQDIPARRYADAQIDDYQGLPRNRFRWQAPLRLSVRARFSHPEGELRGTAGFGFWNDPFLMTGVRLPALPRAIWFFYASPPSDMALALDVPGHGWKATTIDAIRLGFFGLAPAAPLAVPLMNVRPVYRALWPLAQRAIGVSEAALDLDMTAWHTYQLIWGRDEAHFEVDGRTVLRRDTPPRGRLGFVMWLDNQYAIVTPWGRLGYGLLEIAGRQWMEAEFVRIEPGD
jgi:hypothetical protein